jgi:S1-C subfamily serine protease
MALVLLAFFMSQAAPPPQKPIELHSVMMEATIKIVGPADLAKPQLVRTGTGFVVGRPVPDQPNRSYFVLVTAAHVFRDIQGENAVLIVRTKAETGPYQRREHPIRIRIGSSPLWTEHPDSDVAVMYVALPDNVALQPIPDEFLATDSDFTKWEFHPGDEVFTVGYPHGFEANEFGFPVLRSGRIASFPLAPAAALKNFKVDFSVFGGNSGGPIYINQLGRQYGNSYNIDERVFRVLGLVSQQISLTATGERLNVAVVVHAHFIRGAIALLPPHPAGGK